ncbi:alpha/beta-hydrolase [Xylariaceae sp. FL0016]|nr:alpha/beta-hydrolase [Xylariaceae sp. FL0016]
MIPLTASIFRPPELSASAVVAVAATLTSLTLLKCIAFPGDYRVKTRDTPWIPSPRKTLLPQLSAYEIRALPYPPDALPGARDVETPYGSIRVYEWGPEDGERVLLVHGISTPIVALGNLAHELVGRGRRVMCFDLFGRGYSDAPLGARYDAQLYTTQMLLVLASSHLPWLSPPGFHLVGYSLGGGLSVAFTRYYPNLVRSLTLVASCGLIRPHHIGWRSWLYYSSGLLPEWLVQQLVRRRIRPQREVSENVEQEVSGTDIVAAEARKEVLVNGDGDSNGGTGFDSAMISQRWPGVTVSEVVRWQLDHHEGFVMAFLSTIRNAPIYAPQEDWCALSVLLQERRIDSTTAVDLSNKKVMEPGLCGGKVLLVLGEDDPVIVRHETVEDAEAVLGADVLEVAVLPGGHELPITNSAGVAGTLEWFWRHREN